MRTILLVLAGMLAAMPCQAQTIEGPDEVAVHDVAWYHFVDIKDNQSVGVWTGGRDYIKWGPPDLSSNSIFFHPTEKGTYLIDGLVLWSESNGTVKWMPLTKKVVVTGDTPEPPDPPDPPTPPDPPDPPTPVPDTKYQVMLFTDSTLEDNMSNEQVAILNGLKFRDELKEKGYVFKGCYNVSSGAQASWPITHQKQCVVDSRGNQSCTLVPVRSAPKELKGWWDVVKGDPLPRIAIAPLEGGTIKDYPLPETESEVWKLLENPQ